MEKAKKRMDKKDLETKRIADALKVSELRYRRLFETTNNGILILDYKTGKVVDVNPFLMGLLGFPKEKFVGQQLWELGFFGDIAKNKANFLKLKRNRSIRYEDLPMETAEGLRINVEFVSNVYISGHQKVIQCNIGDITERRKLSLVKDQFLNTTSHELKSPLIPIKSQCQLLLGEDYGALNEEQKEAVEMILRNENHLERLVTDVLDIARAKSNRLKFDFERVNLGKILSDSLASVEDTARKKDITLSLKIPPALPRILADSKRIAQVMSNLLNNALKDTPEKGAVTVTVTKTKDRIQVAVRDTGIGMDKSTLEKIFTPFFQADSGLDRRYIGSGLGLAICKEIIVAHGGKIWGLSEGEHKGSTLIFTLPLKMTKQANKSIS